MYATRWFVTVFAAQFPAPFAARAWDRFLAEAEAVYQIGVALLPRASTGSDAGLRGQGAPGGSRRLVGVERTLGSRPPAARDARRGRRGRRRRRGSPGPVKKDYGVGRGGRDLRRAAVPHPIFALGCPLAVLKLKTAAASCAAWDTLGKAAEWPLRRVCRPARAELD